MSVRRLLWKDHASVGGYHAALFSSRVLPPVDPHTHDFFELVYVLSGAATHDVNSRGLPLQSGDLIFIRSDDRHGISFGAGAELEFVNIAFPADAWAGFRALAGLDREEFVTVRANPLPPAVRLSTARGAECAQIFQRTLRAFYQRPSRLELCAFLSLALPFLLRPMGGDGADDTALPAWLQAACLAIRDDENLRRGLSRFVELGGVSRAHLSRTLKAYCGRTPTAYINELRLERAALLLATTTLDIVEVAAECGFDNLSYFYRLFGQRYGASPRAYRLHARYSVAP